MALMIRRMLVSRAAGRVGFKDDEFGPRALGLVHFVNEVIGKRRADGAVHFKHADPCHQIERVRARALGPKEIRPRATKAKSKAHRNVLRGSKVTTLLLSNLSPDSMPRNPLFC